MELHVTQELHITQEALFVLRRKSRVFNPALERINITITVTMNQALPNKFNQPMTDDLSQEYLLWLFAVWF